MARTERERRSVGLLFQSADWGAAPADWKPTTGVLIARMARGEYGLYFQGHWKVYTQIDWQSKFKSVIPAGLPVGWWGVLPVLEFHFGTHRDNFTAEHLADALSRGPVELAALPQRGPRRVQGLNVGDRDVVMV